jgi:CRISPR-associated protein Csm2
MVGWANSLGQTLKNSGLATSQIRALFGEVRRIEGEWQIEGHRERARRRLILLKPKMAYRARKERGRAVGMLVDVLDPAVDLVVEAKTDEDLDGNFTRFVEFFEAILAYHKAHGGN